MDSRSSRRSSRRQLNPYTVHGLTITELKKELEARGLDSTGAKNKLADRLSDFILLGDSPEKLPSTPVAPPNTPQSTSKPKATRKEPPAKKLKVTPKSTPPEPVNLDSLGSLKDKYRQRRRIAASAESISQPSEASISEPIPTKSEPPADLETTVDPPETTPQPSREEEEEKLWDALEKTITAEPVITVEFEEEVEEVIIQQEKEPEPDKETIASTTSFEVSDDTVPEKDIAASPKSVGSSKDTVPDRGESECTVQQEISVDEDFIEETVEIEIVPTSEKKKKRKKSKDSKDLKASESPDIIIEDERRSRKRKSKKHSSRKSSEKRSVSPVSSLASEDSRHKSERKRHSSSKSEKKRRASGEAPEDSGKASRKEKKEKHKKSKKRSRENESTVIPASDMLVGAVDKQMRFLSEKLSKRRKPSISSSVDYNDDKIVADPLTQASELPDDAQATTSDKVVAQDTVTSNRKSKEKDPTPPRIADTERAPSKDPSPPRTAENEKTKKQNEPKSRTDRPSNSEKAKRAPSPLSLLLGTDISIDPAKSCENSPRESSQPRDSPSDFSATVPLKVFPPESGTAGPGPSPLINQAALYPSPPPPPPPPLPVPAPPPKPTPFSSLEARIRELGIAPMEPAEPEPSAPEFWKGRAEEWAARIGAICEPPPAPAEPPIGPSEPVVPDVTASTELIPSESQSLAQISSSDIEESGPDAIVQDVKEEEQETTVKSAPNTTFETVSSAELETTVDDEPEVLDISLTDIPLPGEDLQLTVKTEEDPEDKEKDLKRPNSVASSRSSSRSSRSRSRSSCSGSSRSHSTSPSRSSGEEDEADLPEGAATGKKDGKGDGKTEEEEEDDETDSDEEQERIEAEALAEEQRRQKLLREAKQAEEKKKLEDVEYPIDESIVQLDYFNADLHMRVLDTDGLSAEPVNQDGFALAWAGIKASFGVSKGKIGFQVKIVHELDITHITSEEAFSHEIRIGWSLKEAPLLLGEAMGSYSYSNTARKAQNGCFALWGQSFNKDDVISCCFNFDDKTILYWKNEISLGCAFTIGNDEIECVDEGGPPYFPHVATKNCRFEINFGKKEWIPLPDGFTFINEVPREDRTRNYEPPKEKSNCMVIMMVGLPAAGKSRWVQKYLRDFQGERWEVISSDTVVDLMKVNGVARHKCHKGRWDVVMGLASKAANKQLQLACRKKKNFILDMTNVMSATRRRKMLPFKDFGKKAVVIVPTEEDHANRRLRQAQELGREIPAEAMLELKACFTLPTLDEGGFDDIIYAEQDEERAQKIVERYNEEGKSWKPPERTRMGGRMSHGGQFRRRGGAPEEFDGNRGKLSEQDIAARAARASASTEAKAADRTSEPSPVAESPNTPANEETKTATPSSDAPAENGVGEEEVIPVEHASEDPEPDEEARVAQPLLDEVVPLTEP